MNNNNNTTTTNNNNLNTKPLILNWKLKDKIKQESIIQLHPIVKNPFDLINSSKNYYNYFNIDPINEIESITVYDNFMIMNWNCCNSNELNENEFGVLFWCIFINDNFIGTSHSSCYAITHKNNVNNVNKFKFNLRIDCIDKLGCTISGRTISLKFSI
ncbi:unnamed protein product [[Candida] boidinii]|nr:unnamed protein product [[Candida] boidinii]